MSGEVEPRSKRPRAKKSEPLRAGEKAGKTSSDALPANPFTRADLEWVVTLDVSVKSAGVCAYHLPSNRLHWFGFAPNASYLKDFSDADITLFPPVPLPAEASDAMRYQYIWSSVASGVQALPGWNPTTADAFMEDYAHKSGSAHGQKLREIGGVIMHGLWKEFGMSTTKINISTWKRVGVGHDKATKQEVHDCVHTQWPYVHFLERLRQRPSEKDRKTGYLPTPAQDLSDTTGILRCVLYFRQHPEKWQSKQRRRTRFRTPAIAKAWRLPTSES